MPGESAATPNRRAYADVGIAPHPAGFAIMLDGRTGRTPAGAPLALPTPATADRVAAEWAAQGDRIDPATMPVTRLACTAIDRTAANMAEVAGEVARYAGSDVLCYFAEAPPSLVEMQVGRWGPVLDWAGEALGVTMLRTSGVSPLEQPAESLARIEALAGVLDPFALTGVAFATALFGSALLAFAVQRGQLSAVAAFELSRLDEAFQIARWGEDAEAAARTDALRREAEMVGAWLAALGPGGARA